MSEREGYRGEALDWMILLRERPDDQDVHARFRQWGGRPEGTRPGVNWAMSMR